MRQLHVWAGSVLLGLALPAASDHVPRTLDLGLLWKPAPGNPGYLNFDTNPGLLGAEHTGHTRRLTQAVLKDPDGREDDVCDNSVEVAVRVLIDQAGAGPTLQPGDFFEDVDYANKMFAQAGIRVLYEAGGAVKLQGNGVTSPWAAADVAPAFTANRSPVANALHQAYVDFFPGLSQEQLFLPGSVGVGSAGVAVKDLRQKPRVGHALAHLVLDQLIDVLADPTNAMFDPLLAPHPGKLADVGRGVGTVARFDFAQIRDLHASAGNGYVQHESNENSHGDRVDFDWVADDSFIAFANTPDGDLRPGFDPLRFVIDPVGVGTSAHRGPRARGHAHGGKKELDFPAFAGNTFRTVDIFSNASRYVDNDGTLRSDALDFETPTFVLNTQPPTRKLGVLVNVWVPGWTRNARSDNFVSRWSVDQDAVAIELESHTLQNHNGSSQIDAVLAYAQALPPAIPGRWGDGVPNSDPNKREFDGYEAPPPAPKDKRFGMRSDLVPGASPSTAVAAFVENDDTTAGLTLTAIGGTVQAGSFMTEHTATITDANLVPGSFVPFPGGQTVLVEQSPVGKFVDFQFQVQPTGTTDVDVYDVLVEPADPRLQIVAASATPQATSALDFRVDLAPEQWLDCATGTAGYCVNLRDSVLPVADPSGLGFIFFTHTGNGPLDFVPDPDGYRVTAEGTPGPKESECTAVEVAIPDPGSCPNPGQIACDYRAVRVESSELVFEVVSGAGEGSAGAKIELDGGSRSLLAGVRYAVDAEDHELHLFLAQRDGAADVIAQTSTPLPESLYEQFCTRQTDPDPALICSDVTLTLRYDAAGTNASLEAASFDAGSLGSLTLPLSGAARLVGTSAPRMTGAGGFVEVANVNPDPSGTPFGANDTAGAVFGGIEVASYELPDPGAGIALTSVRVTTAPEPRSSSLLAAGVLVLCTLATLREAASRRQRQR